MTVKLRLLGHFTYLLTFSLTQCYLSLDTCRWTPLALTSAKQTGTQISYHGEIKKTEFPWCWLYIEMVYQTITPWSILTAGNRTHGILISSPASYPLRHKATVLSLYTMSQKKTFNTPAWSLRSVYNCLLGYAAVIIGRIIGLARLSLSPSVWWFVCLLRATNSKTKRCR